MTDLSKVISHSAVPIRRQSRISLRTLLIGLAVASLLLGWIGVVVHRKITRDTAIAALRAAGAQVLGNQGDSRHPSIYISFEH